MAVAPIPIASQIPSNSRSSTMEGMIAMNSLDIQEDAIYPLASSPMRRGRTSLMKNPEKRACVVFLDERPPRDFNRRCQRNPWLMVPRMLRRTAGKIHSQRMAAISPDRAFQWVPLKAQAKPTAATK